MISARRVGQVFKLDVFKLCGIKIYSLFLVLVNATLAVLVTVSENDVFSELVVAVGAEPAVFFCVVYGVIGICVLVIFQVTVARKTSAEEDLVYLQRLFYQPSEFVTNILYVGRAAGAE